MLQRYISLRQNEKRRNKKRTESLLGLSSLNYITYNYNRSHCRLSQPKDKKLRLIRRVFILICKSCGELRRCRELELLYGRTDQREVRIVYAMKFLREREIAKIINIFIIKLITITVKVAAVSFARNRVKVLSSDMQKLEERTHGRSWSLFVSTDAACKTFGTSGTTYVRYTFRIFFVVSINTYTAIAHHGTDRCHRFIQFVVF